MDLKNAERVLRLEVLLHVPNQVIELLEVNRVLNLCAESQEEGQRVDLDGLRAGDRASLFIAKHDRNLSQELVHQSQHDVFGDHGTVSGIFSLVVKAHESRNCLGQSTHIMSAILRALALKDGFKGLDEGD